MHPLLEIDEYKCTCTATTPVKYLHPQLLCPCKEMILTIGVLHFFHQVMESIQDLFLAFCIGVNIFLDQGTSVGKLEFF